MKFTVEDGTLYMLQSAQAYSCGCLHDCCKHGQPLISRAKALLRIKSEDIERLYHRTWPRQVHTARPMLED